jgi:hypothetical protein
VNTGSGRTIDICELNLLTLVSVQKVCLRHNSQIPVKKNRKLSLAVKRKAQTAPVVKAARQTKNEKKSTGALANLLGLLGTGAGGFLGGPSGAALGGSIGSSAGKLISSVTGFGDYKIKSNSLVKHLGGAAPVFINKTDSGVRICNREMVCNVGGSVSFNVNRYPINPGNSFIFPWLSEYAPLFEQYKVHGMIFHYNPSSGYVGAASPALGTVMMATQYDVFDGPFSSKQELLGYQYSTSIMAANPDQHPIECAPNSMQFDKLKCRFGAVPSGATQQAYDVGQFSVATEGMQSAYVVGELWVTYDIEFFKPKLTPCSGAEMINRSNALSTTASATNPFSGCLDGVQCENPFNNLPVFTTPSGVTRCSVHLITATTLHFDKKGEYLLVINWEQAAGTFTANGGIVATGVNLVTKSAPMLANLGTFSATAAVRTLIVEVLEDFNNVTGSNNLQFTGPTGATAATCSIMVCCLPQGTSTITSSDLIVRTTAFAS